MERLLIEVIDEEGGPLIHNCDSEEEQRSFDATCRKLYRYLTVIQQAKQPSLKDVSPAQPQP